MKPNWFWMTSSILIVLGTTGIIYVSIIYWDWLSTNESGLTVVVIIIALLVAMWRSMIAERQTNTTQEGLQNERYKKGAEMLGSKFLSVRLGGIYALQRLAKEHPMQNHVQIMQLFCAFVCDPPKAREATDLLLGKDIQTVMEAIGGRSKEGIELENKEDFKLDFRSANLGRLFLKDADLSSANFESAIFSNADLWGVDLSNCQCLNVRFSNANLNGANLSDAFLEGAKFSDVLLANANLSDANLLNTDLSGAWLYDPDSDIKNKVPVKGLTQDQLDQAYIYSNNPPHLDGYVFDAATGERLEWRGQSI